jgi:2-methylcitrate dehydratase PrpD
MTLSEELVGWASTLQLEDVPARVVDYAKSQLLSQLAAARAGQDHPLGDVVTRALGSPLQADPKQAACSLAGLTSWLHFDDTAYAGHLSHSTVNVPVAYAAACGLDGRGLLTAIIAANECAARVTAATTLSNFRGQTASWTSLAGAVCGRLHSERAPAQQWVDALGLALSTPPRTLNRAFLGSDGKILGAPTSVRIGLDACDGAAAGLSGAPDIFEHPQGFLAAFASVPLPETITEGLGRRWHTETLSFKVHPAGPGLDAAIDCALDLHAELGDLDPDDVAEVVVFGSRYTVTIDHEVAPYMDGARSPISALACSAPYLVATALLRGDLTPADFALPRLGEPERWTLAAKVRVAHDPAMTRRSRLSAVPMGEALRAAGSQAAGDWLTSLGAGDLGDFLDVIEAPSETFERAEKVTPARVVIHLADGRTLAREHDIPVGAAGPDTRVRHGEIVRAKFLSCGGAAEVADAAQALESATNADVTRLLRVALTPDRRVTGSELAAGTRG